jgi:hypothetical protein
MRNIDNSPEYYRMREARERELAERAKLEEVKAIHRALAENYRLAAEEAERRSSE